MSTDCTISKIENIMEDIKNRFYDYERDAWLDFTAGNMYLVFAEIIEFMKLQEWELQEIKEKIDKMEL